MKETLTKFGIIAVVALIAAGGAYFYAMDKLKNIVIDNPTSAEIVVKIDETEYKIPANGSVNAKISYGKHSATLNGENVGEFEHAKQNISSLILNFFDLKASVINPTKTQYVIVTEVYSTRSGGANTISDPVVRDLYIPATWNYGLDEVFPAQVTTSSRRGSSSKDIYKKKIFRVADYTKEYQIEVGPEDTLITYDE